ncbi:exported hypothetical protein [Cupriavidus taiwanensis]|uniref:Uncharacterized protein n=1 Tax=Cupriavidus taiwanensis TaxID=164546 RepID=A0A375IYX3_9BURK|nr:exported hypothetical protein [Cupriavidus taiwanensis]
MRREKRGWVGMVFSERALVLIIGSCLASTPSASTGASLQILYQVENLIIYTYVLGQIYLGLVKLMPAAGDHPKTARPDIRSGEQK